MVLAWWSLRLRGAKVSNIWQAECFEEETPEEVLWSFYDRWALRYLRNAWCGLVINQPEGDTIMDRIFNKIRATDVLIEACKLMRGPERDAQHEDWLWIWTDIGNISRPPRRGWGWGSWILIFVATRARRAPNQERSRAFLKWRILLCPRAPFKEKGGDIVERESLHIETEQNGWKESSLTWTWK